MKLKPCSRFVLLAAQTILLGGCATSALWEEGRFARFREPAAPANLRMFQSSADVLVQYDETSDENDSVRRRAYWLGQNHEPVKNPHRPRFVLFAAAQGLAPVPVVAAAATGLPTNAAIFAVVSTNGADFSLYSGGKMVGAYELPVYADASGRTKQVLLTPVAVAADLTIIGTFLFLSAWASGGLSGVH